MVCFSENALPRSGGEYRFHQHEWYDTIGQLPGYSTHLTFLDHLFFKMLAKLYASFFSRGCVSF